MKLLTICMMLLCIYSGTTYASDNAGAFLEQSIQARASAMGMSHVSIARGSDSVYWNPALLPRQHYSEVKVMQTKAFETHYISAQSFFRVYDIPIGIGYTNAYLGGIKETTEGSTSGRYTFTGSELDYSAHALLISSGWSVNDSFSMGITTKWIREMSAGYRATGLGLDLGVVYIFSEDIKMGVNIQNAIKPSMEWNTPSRNIDTIPTNIKVGGGLKCLNDTLLTSVDINFRHDRRAKASVGLELLLSPQVSLRAGFDEDNLSLGVGLVLDPLTIDFSLKNPSSSYMEDIYLISVGFKIL